MLEFVLVGDPGAPPEPTTGLGRVTTSFRMGRYEITNAQYAQFLNSTAVFADPHGLWHRNHPNHALAVYGRRMARSIGGASR